MAICYLILQINKIQIILQQRYTRKKVLTEIKRQGRRNVSKEIGFTGIKKTTQFGSNKGSGGGADATALFEGAAYWMTAYRYSLRKILMLIIL